MEQFCWNNLLLNPLFLLDQASKTGLMALIILWENSEISPLQPVTDDSRARNNDKSSVAHDLFERRPYMARIATVLTMIVIIFLLHRMRDKFIYTHASHYSVGL